MNPVPLIRNPICYEREVNRKMLIQHISDIHLEFGRKMPKGWISKDVDLLVFAGDICTIPKTANKFFKEIRQSTDIPVIYVIGNHEYYRQVVTVIDNYREVASKNNVILLENEVVVIDNIKFLGATLYSDLSKYSEAIAVRLGLSDFRVVKQDPELYIDIDWWQDKFRESTKFIEREINNSAIITHFCPLRSLTRNNTLAAGFASDLSRLFYEYNPKAWIYGHTHEPVDTIVNNCRIVSNPVGYVEECIGVKTRIIEVDGTSN